MERRTALVTAGLALGTPLVGCLGSPANGDGTDHENGGGRATSGGNGTAAGSHHLYLVNLDDESQRIVLEVVARAADEHVLEGTYEIPGEKGGEFREIAARGKSYDVTATVEADATKTFSWKIDPCPGARPENNGAELPSGSRNGSVRIESGADDISFLTDSCDEIIAGTEVPVGPAEQFEVEGE